MQVDPTDIASKSHVTPLPRYSIDPSDLLETKNASANECDPPLALAIEENIVSVLKIKIKLLSRYFTAIYKCISVNSAMIFCNFEHRVRWIWS